MGMPRVRQQNQHTAGFEQVTLRIRHRAQTRLYNDQHAVPQTWIFFIHDNESNGCKMKPYAACCHLAPLLARYTGHDWLLDVRQTTVSDLDLSQLLTDGLKLEVIDCALIQGRCNISCR